MLVSARRVALAAGVLAAVFAIVVFVIRPVPDAVLSLVGGPDGGIARHGGLTLRYRPPATADLRRFEASLAEGHGRREARVRHDGDAIVVELPGVAEAEAARLANVIAHGGVQFREVVESDALAGVPCEKSGSGVTASARSCPASRSTTRCGGPMKVASRATTRS